MQIISNEDVRDLHYDRETKNVILYDDAKAARVEHSHSIFPQIAGLMAVRWNKSTSALLTFSITTVASSNFAYGKTSMKKKKKHYFMSARHNLIMLQQKRHT